MRVRAPGPFGPSYRLDRLEVHTSYCHVAWAGFVASPSRSRGTLTVRSISTSLRGQRGALEADKELEVEVRADGEEDREPEHRVMVRRTRPHPAAAAVPGRRERIVAVTAVEPTVRDAVAVASHRRPVRHRERRGDERDQTRERRRG